MKMYTFCKVFHISPTEYYKQGIEDIDVMLELHKEVKQLQDETNKKASKLR